MTLAATSRVNYPGAGSTGPFTIPFRFTTVSDLVVVRRSAANVETTLTNVTHYTVTGAGDDEGELTLVSALAVGEALAICRRPAFTQTTSFQNQGSYFGRTHELALDRAMMIIQALKDDADRGFRVSQSFDPSILSLEVKPETGKVLAWQSATELGNSALDTSAVTVPTGRAVSTISEFILNNALVNPKDMGAAGDGAADDRAEFAAADLIAAAGGMGFVPKGTYLISSNITLEGTYQFARGAILKPANGVTITLSGSIIAGLYQIFDCSLGGSIVVGSDPVPDIEMNPIWFGADPGPFANDGTTAFQKCFASGAQRFFIPWGQYDVSGTITLPASFGRPLVRGAGIPSSIYFNPSANNLPLFAGTTGDNWEFRDFQVHNNNSGSRTGITGFDFANANISGVRFERVFVSAFNSYGIKLTDAQYLKVKDCRFTDMIAAIGQPVAVAIGSTTFINAGVVRGCRFAGNDKAFKVSGFGSLGISECSFEGEGRLSLIADADRGAILDLAWDGASPGVGFSFKNNYIEAAEPGTGHAFLELLNVAGASISANSFVGQLGGGLITRKFVKVSGSVGRGVRISDNRFDTVAVVGGAGTYAFIETLDCVVRAYGNSYYQLGTGELTDHNAVLAFMIHNSKIEFDNLTQSAAWNPANLADGVGETSAALPMTGAAFGDAVIASFDKDLQGILLTAWVSSAGNVMARLQNETGGALDLANGTLRARIRKMDA